MLTSFAERHRQRARDRARQRARDRAPAGPVRDYLTVAQPPHATPLERLPLLALDFETTGLDPSSAHIVSVGFVPLDGRIIRFDGARRLIVRPDGDVGDSATVHGLTDDVVEQGVELADAVELVLSQLAGRFLLAHHAVIETEFLISACKKLYGDAPRLRNVDTLRLHERVLTAASLSHHPELAPGALRLWAARERYGLPVYRAHDALIDALACAELYLAQSAELGANRPLLARHVLTRRGT